jgi:hypothetical protein
MYRMSFRDYFPDDESGQSWKSGEALAPAWAVVNNRTYGGATERNGAILTWLNRVTERLLEWREPITRVQRTNRRIFVGQHYFSQDMFNSLPYNRGKQFSKNNAQIVVNHIGYLTEQHVADMCSYEPALAVTPTNDEEIDRVSARLKKDVLDYYWYEKKIKMRFQKFHRAKKIDGEAFWFCLWNPEMGDYNAKYKKLLEIRKQQGLDDVSPKIGMVDPDSGAPLLAEDGQQIFIEKPVYTGEVELRQVLAEHVLYPYPKSHEWDDVPFLEYLEWLPVEEAKARWPHAADQLRADSMYKRYYSSGRSLTNDVCIRHFYHKPSRFLDLGYSIASTEHVILEQGNYPYDHGMLPCIRGTDIEAAGEIHGISFIQNLASLQHGLNNSTSMILQNQALFAYPKYMVPRGAKVRYRDLDDDRGIYEYSGAKGPELVTSNSTPPDTWRWRDMLRDEMKTLSGIYATSEGRAPDGITANVALRMVDEQERKFRKPQIDRHSENVQRLGEMLLSVLGTYRDASDGAMIKVVGRNNERYLRYLDVQNLKRPTEVQLLRSSGLPDSPAARTQTVLDLAERFPDLWQSDEILEFMDIQRPEKLIESGTLARRAAESEVEDILQGVPNVIPPQQYHDIIPKYAVYLKAVQSRAFDEATPEIKARMIVQIQTAEYFMMRKMRNPAFQQLVLTRFPAFPMFMPQQPLQTEAFQLPDMADPMMGADPMGGVPPEEAGENAAMPAEQTAAPQRGPAPAPMPPPEQSGALP